MNMSEIRTIAEKRKIKAGKMKKTDLIRTIQKTEGNNDCYATAYVRECNQLACLWRKDCQNEN